MSAAPLPQDYNRAQEAGRVDLSCRAIECFRPHQFDLVGYPTSINSLAELWKYTESMHEGLGLREPADQYFVSTYLAGGFTKGEFAEASRIKEAIDDLSAAIGRRAEYPTHSLVLAFNQARHISALCPPGSMVIELGGGAGYLGALLTLRGYRYVATDVAQAFYLLQSHLISRVAPKGCIDLVDPALGPNELKAIEPGQAAMVPWWRWVRPEIPGAVAMDLVTSNHNLLEMHPYSRLYHLRVMREALSPEAVGLVFQGWGDPSRTPLWTVVKELTEAGFDLAHNDQRITCFVPRDRHPREFVLRNPLPPEARPAPQPKAAPGAVPQSAPPSALHNLLRRSLPMRAARKLIIPYAEEVVLKLRTETYGPFESRLEQLTTRLNAIEGTPRINPEWGAPDFREPRNAVSRAVMAMRNREDTERAFGLSDYQALMGGGDLSTQDERFLSYVFEGTDSARPWITAKPS